MALRRNKDGRYYLDDEEEIKQYSAKNRQLYFHPTAEENNAFQAKQRQEQRRIQQQSQAVKQVTTASLTALKGVSSRLTPARVTTIDDMNAKSRDHQMSPAAPNRVTPAGVARTPVVPTREVIQKTEIDKNILNDEGLSSKELIQKYSDLLNGKTSYSDNTKKALYKQGQKSLRKLTSDYYKSPEWGKIARGDIPWTETAKEMKVASELMDELYRQSSFGAGILGAIDSMSFGYASNPFFASDDVKQQQKEMHGRSQQANPVAYGTGQFIGEATKYNAIAPLLKEVPGVNTLTKQWGDKLSKGASKLPGIGKALSKFATPDRMAGLVGDQLLDTVVGTPQIIGEGVEDGKSGWGITEDLLQNQLTNLGTNVGMDLLGEGVKAIGRKGQEVYSNHKIDTMPKPSLDEIGVHEVKAGTKLDGSLTNPNYRTDIPEHLLKVSNAAPSSAKLKADISLFDENILKNTNQARKNYIAYAREHFPDIVKNQETGMEIGISRNGLDKLMSGNITKEKYASAFYVPELIEQATKVAEAPYIKKKTGISRYHYFDSPIEIEGKDYTAHIRVRDTDVGNKYYGHTISIVDGIKIEPGTRGSTESSVLHSVKEVPDSSELSSSQRTDVPADAVPGVHVQDALSNFDTSVTSSISENSGKIKELPIAKRQEPVLLPLAERKHPVSLPIAGKTDVIADTQRRGYNQSGGVYYGRTESQLTGLQDVGRTAQFDTGRGGIYSESDPQNGRTNGGAQSQQTKRITRKIGNVDVEYNLASPEILNDAVKSIQQQFSEYGIDAEIVDGEAGYRRGGKEYTPAPANGRASSAPTDQGGSDPMDILDINEKLKAEREARLASDPLVQAVRDTYQQMGKTYGTIPTGESAIREANVPKRTEPNDRVSQSVRTMMESKAVPDSMMSDFEREIVKGTFSYTPISDTAAINKAKKSIQTHGYNGARTMWDAVVMGDRVAGKEDIALGEMILAEAAKAGDTKLAMKTAAELSAEATRAGQTVQAYRLLKKMTPEGQLYYIQKTVDNLNSDLSKKRRPSSVKIKEELAQELLTAPTHQARDKVIDQLYTDIASQLPASWADKWNAWRYMAMLGNLRTHIRNLAGNAVFMPARKLKDAIGAGIEAGTNKVFQFAGKDTPVERTKALLIPGNSKDKALKAFAKSDWPEVREITAGGGKMNPSDIIRDRKTIFRTKPLEWLRKTNSGALEAEDVLFLRNAYTDSFAQAAKARGYTPEFLSSGTKEANDALGSLRNYAINEAQKATYRDASAVATALNRMKNVNVFTKVLGEGLLPFTKTPVNILKRGVEYSPIGLLRGLKQATFDVKAGKRTAAEAIDMISSGLSGTGILLLGGYLTSQGLLTAGGSEDKKEQGFDALQGSQNYALNIGDTSYTIDWMAPVALPLFTGAEIYNLFKQDDPQATPGRIFDAISNISEPLFELSMLQGLNNTFQAASNSTNPSLAILNNTVAGYVSQAVPTLFGQIARTIDPVRRSTYVDKNSSVPEIIQRTLQKAQAKIPFASKGLQPYVDQWGREEHSDNLGLRIFENFLSPGYISQNKSTVIDKEIERLYGNTGDRAVLPNYASKSVTMDGEKVQLTAEQHTDFAKKAGNTAFRTVEELIQRPGYQALSAEDQTKLIRDIYSYANNQAKREVLGYEPSGWEAKAQQAFERKRIAVSDYLLQKHQYDSLETIKDGPTAAEQYREYLMQDDTLSAEEKRLFDGWMTGTSKPADYSNRESFILSRMPEGAQELYSYPSVQDAVGGIDNYVKVHKILSETKGDKDEYGNTISGTAKQKQIVAIANELNVTSRQAENIYNELRVYKHSLDDLSSSARKKYEVAAAHNMSEKKFLRLYNLYLTVEGSKDANGKTISGSKKRNAIYTFMKNGLSQAQAEYFYQILTAK